MMNSDLLQAKNRRTGITIFLIFLILTGIAVTFVILRKYGHA